MKTLLTLILFLIYQVGIGQGIDTNFVPVGKWGKLTNADENIRPSIIHNDSLDNIKEEEWIDVYTSASLLRLWKAYQQECWNDSVYKMYYSRISPGNFAVHYPDTLICEYSHRKPTFEGFMQYLERRIKR